MTKTPPNIHAPWKMHSKGIPFVICGRQGPSFGPVTYAGTEAEMIAIATLMRAAPDLLAMCEAWISPWGGYSADELQRRSRKGFDHPDTVSRILATRAAIKRARGE